jgi:mono/diheme cytochrome c family protein
MSMVDYESVKLGAKSLECASCHGQAKLVFNPGNVSFVMKDGETGGFQSKAIKENTWRAKHRVEMARRERDHVFKTKLIPNYEGQQTESWREAQEHARKDGKDTATYTPLIRREGSST